MDDVDFRTRFRNNQIGMRDLSAIRRNAIIAAGNSRMDSFMPALKKLTRDPDPMIRQHSLWSVAKIGGQAVRALLEKALGVEPDPVVRRDIKSLLDGVARFA